ncbi:MAG: CDP-alcohol phosphatidyltransferase family protein [Candidatus Nanopelagicales bacterium]|jgi:CDP-diacylglycerol--glycerol-3-phosphate 3-phosphatidyltransferase|nr:CDP-alcohol phosphatidyltransferase family protein [Candidatus Nanopelagicales bacterium]
MLNNAEARGFVAPVVEPVARALLRTGLSADAVTVIGAAITVTAALWLIPQGRFIPALVIVSFFIAADVLDGTMARLSGTQGPYGAWLDATLDRVADVAVFGGLVMWAAWHSDTLTTYLAWACLAGAVAISYAKARAEAVGATANGGIAERAERLIVVGVGAILYVLGVSWAMTLALGVLAVLVAVTLVQRALDVRSQLRPTAAVAPAPGASEDQGTPDRDADADPGS